MENKISFAVLGCGLISDFHIQAILAEERAALAGVCDHNIEAAEKKAQQYHTTAILSFEEILSRADIDAVCICTPSGFHSLQALQTIRAGKHVLIEKPAALTLEECDRLIAEASHHHVKASVVSQLRFSSSFHRIQNIISQGHLGTLVSAHLAMNYYRAEEYYSKSDWRGTYKMDGGGALINQGIHGIDLMLALMGPVDTVSAHARTLVHSIETEDTLCALLSFQNQALGTVQATTCAYPGTLRTLSIFGSKGSITLTESSISRFDIEGYPPNTNFNMTISSDNQRRSASDPANINHIGHQRQIHNFVMAILGKESLLVTLQDGKAAIELILRCYNSAGVNQS